MKKKSLAALLSGFLTVCLTGVGFASWIIVQGDTETVSGKVNVENITPKEITLSYAWDGNNDGVSGVTTTTTTDGVTTYGDDALSFGKNTPATAPTYGWLQNPDGHIEVLTLKLDVTVTNVQLVSKTNGVTFAIAPNAEGKTNYESAISAGYITEVTAYAEGTTDKFKKFTTETGAQTITIVISAKWGAHFGGSNPFEYYNNHKSSDKLSGTETTYAEDANASLGQLYTYLSIVSFNLTITAEG